MEGVVAGTPGASPNARVRLPVGPLYLYAHDFVAHIFQAHWQEVGGWCLPLACYPPCCMYDSPLFHRVSEPCCMCDSPLSHRVSEPCCMCARPYPTRCRNHAVRLVTIICHTRCPRHGIVHPLCITAGRSPITCLQRGSSPHAVALPAPARCCGMGRQAPTSALAVSP